MAAFPHRRKPPGVEFGGYDPVTSKERER